MLVLLFELIKIIEYLYLFKMYAIFLRFFCVLSLM